MSIPAPPGARARRYSVADSHNKNSGAVIRRQLYVIHTAECPLKVGYAQSLTAWGNGGYQPRASWQKFVDPATVVSWIPLSRAAWHAAPANRLSVGYEQAGYARFTRAQWLTTDGLKQIDLLAQEIVRDGIPASGLRWLTDAQVRAVLTGNTSTYGLCTHAQVVKVGKALGHTLAGRTDPGAGYPKDYLLAWVKHYHASGGTIPPPTAPKELTRLLVSGSRAGETRSRDNNTGGEVSLLQNMLNDLAGAGLDVDGSFGPATEAEVKTFQRHRGLDVDGRVGPATRSKINALWRERSWLDMATEAQVEALIRKVVREEVAGALGDRETWRKIFTGMSFFKDPTTPGQGELPGEERIQLGRLMEIAAIAALDAAQGEE